jgi:hypothetical protein
VGLSAGGMEEFADASTEQRPPRDRRDKTRRYEIRRGTIARNSPRKSGRLRDRASDRLRDDRPHLVHERLAALLEWRQYHAREFIGAIGEARSPAATTPPSQILCAAPRNGVINI